MWCAWIWTRQSKRFTSPLPVRRQSQWPRGLRYGSAAAHLLRSWVRIPPGAWMFVCCECYALSGRGLCDELITRPEKSYRLWCVVVCDQETSKMRRPWPALGRSATENKQTNYHLGWVCHHVQLWTVEIRCGVTTLSFPLVVSRTDNFPSRLSQGQGFKEKILSSSI